MDELKDGIYVFMSAGAKGEKPMGRFQVDHNRIVYATSQDEEAIGDTFAAGPISDYTRHNLMKYLSGHGSYAYLKYEGA